MPGKMHERCRQLFAATKVELQLLRKRELPGQMEWG
jgi:hypothetical protein